MAHTRSPCPGSFSKTSILTANWIRSFPSILWLLSCSYWESEPLCSWNFQLHSLPRQNNPLTLGNPHKWSGACVCGHCSHRQLQCTSHHLMARRPCNSDQSGTLETQRQAQIPSTYIVSTSRDWNSKLLLWASLSAKSSHWIFSPSLFYHKSYQNHWWHGISILSQFFFKSWSIRWLSFVIKCPLWLNGWNNMGLTIHEWLIAYVFLS